MTHRTAYSAVGNCLDDPAVRIEQLDGSAEGDNGAPVAADVRAMRRRCGRGCSRKGCAVPAAGGRRTVIKTVIGQFRTIPGGVGELQRDAAKIEEGKVGFTVFHIQAGSASEHLLEQRHGMDDAVDDDDFDKFDIDTRGEELGRGGNDRCGIGNGAEIIELRLSLGIIAGDAHNVIGIRLEHIGIEIGERIAHGERSIGSGAEDDGLGHALAGGGEKIGDLLSHFPGTVLEHDAAPEIVIRIHAVGNRLAPDIHLIFKRTPALRGIEQVAADPERRQKTVINPLRQRVGVKCLPEIIAGRDFRVFLGCGGHAQLHGGLEVFQNRPPLAVCIRGPAMAFVHDDQIKEIAREKPFEAARVLGTDQMLIQ